MLLSLRSRTRVVLVAALTAALAMLVPGVAHAAPPSNDDFDNSTGIAALPFTTQQDAGEATKATDDPFWCQGYNVTSTVWFHYTANANGLLRATTTGSDHSTILSAHTGRRGDLRGVNNACGTGNNATITFRATAGTTYYFMVAGYDVPLGAVSFALDNIAPAANDNFANAEPVSSLPFTAQPDLSIASFEADEPDSTCVYDKATPSVWYAYTTSGPAHSVTARVEASGTAVTVYTGNTLPELRQVACAGDSPSVFRANPGTTNYIRVTGPYVNYQQVKLFLDEAPALQPQISQSPSSPTVFDNVYFSADSWSTIDRPLTAAWDFGDGTTAPSGTQPVSHHYAKDGVYPVTLNATSPDGRTATVTTNVTVNTHDVAITKFSVPASAREGESKPISVDVANTRYPESATVVLSKSDGSSWTQVGTLTLNVPARPDRKVRFPFSYTFTAADALVGKVAFRAQVQLPYPVTDARPADNEVISIATTVNPHAVAARAI
ncbi:MAG TPA: PKD domain-containing protein [Amycolatopsis sp.]|nr:PKD domain-containing protein [Amycolatopsis sp.]